MYIQFDMKDQRNCAAMGNLIPAFTLAPARHREAKTDVYIVDTISVHRKYGYNLGILRINYMYSKKVKEHH
jgi:hypothetical protein